MIGKFLQALPVWLQLEELEDLVPFRDRPAANVGRAAVRCDLKDRHRGIRQPHLALVALEVVEETGIPVGIAAARAGARGRSSESRVDRAVLGHVGYEDDPRAARL